MTTQVNKLFSQEDLEYIQANANWHPDGGLKFSIVTQANVMEPGNADLAVKLYTLFGLVRNQQPNRNGVVYKDAKFHIPHPTKPGGYLATGCQVVSQVFLGCGEYRYDITAKSVDGIGRVV